MFINLQLMAAVQPELQSGENILLMDRPVEHRAALGSIWAVFFGLPFLVMGAISMPPGSWLSASLFLLFGIVMVTGPWGTYNAAKRTVYAITDRRVLIIQETGSKAFRIGNEKIVKTYNEAAFDHVRIVERSNSIGGHVVFSEQHPTQGRVVHFRLNNISEVRSIKTLLHTTFPHCDW